MPFPEFVESLYDLDDRGVDYLVSYDGECGGRGYGEELPPDLKCRKHLLCAGLSTQATFLGRREVTYEALYVSNGIESCMKSAIGPQLEFQEASSW